MRLSRIMIAIVITLLIVFCSAAWGQSLGDPGTVAPPPARKTKAQVLVITKIVSKPVTPTTGRLFVSAEPGATLLVEPINVRNEKAQQGTVPEGRRDFVFNDLKRDVIAWPERWLAIIRRRRKYRSRPTPPDRSRCTFSRLFTPSLSIQTSPLA